MKLRPQSAVVILLKAPRAGLVKTRLEPAIPSGDVAALSVCFAQDAVAKARECCSNVIVAYTPADARPTIESCLPDGLIYLEQCGADFGDRILNAISDTNGLGFAPVAVMVSDAPTVPASYIACGLDAVASGAAQLALGPTADGGFYSVVLARSVRGLFDGIDWHGQLACLRSNANALKQGLKVMQLPGWYDIDTAADLFRLRAELRHDAAACERAPATVRWCNEHPAQLATHSR